MSWAYQHQELWRGCVAAWCPSFRAEGGLVPPLGPDGGALAFFNMNSPIIAQPGAGDGVAMNFDASNSYALGLKPEVIELSSVISISVWVLVRVANSQGSIVGVWGTVQSRQSWVLEFASNGVSPLVATQNGGAYLIQTSTSSVLLNRWSHICAVATPPTARMWIDGVEVTLSNGNFGTPTFVADRPDNANVYVGGDVGNKTLDGCIDDIRVYNRALTPSEAAFLATRRRAAYAPAVRRAYFLPPQQTPASTYYYRYLLNRRRFVA